MSALEFLDYLHRHDTSRDLAWEILHAIRARHSRAGVAQHAKTPVVGAPSPGNV